MKTSPYLLRLANFLPWAVLVGLICVFNNLFATVILTFLFTNVIVFAKEMVKSQIKHQRSDLETAINEIRKMDNRAEKAVNIVMLLFPSILAVILAVGIQQLFRLIR